MVCLVWPGYRFGWFVWFGLAIGLECLSGLGWLKVCLVCLVWTSCWWLKVELAGLGRLLVGLDRL